MGWVKAKDRLPEKKFNYQQKENYRVKYDVFGAISVVTVADYFFNGNRRLGRNPGFQDIGYKITEWYEEEE